jgi:hypothetical protein
MNADSEDEPLRIDFASIEINQHADFDAGRL